MPVQHILRGLLRPNPYQPNTRLQIPPDVAETIGRSLLEHGFFQMPLVRPSPTEEGTFEIADGYQRVFGGVDWITGNKEVPAEVKKGFEKVDCNVADLTNEQMAAAVFEANAKRRDLTAIDLAKFYKRCLEEFKLTQRELGVKHNLTQGEIANTLRLLELPDDIQKKIISREISETVARQLLRLNGEPELQTRVTAVAVKEGYTVNQVDNVINDEIYRQSVSLTPGWNGPKFDPDVECKDCEHKVTANERWSGSKKELRCMDKQCWEKKNKEAEAKAKADLEKQVAAASKKAKGKGAPKIFTSDQLQYGQYHDMETYNLKDLDNPAECKTCTKTALFKYRITDKGDPKKICTDPKCWRAKQTKKTREQNKTLKEEDLALTMELSKALEHVDRNPQRCLTIIAMHVLSKLTGETVGLDMLKIFPDLPKTPNGRLDVKPLLKTLEDRSLEDLLHLAVAGCMTDQRRNNYGYSQFSTKFDARLKRQISFLTGTMKDYRKAVVAWRQANCVGCSRNAHPEDLKDADKIICNNYDADREPDTSKKCPSRYVERAKSEKQPEPPISEKEVLPPIPCDVCSNNGVTCHRERFHTSSNGVLVCESQVVKEGVAVGAGDETDDEA